MENIWKIGKRYFVNTENTYYNVYFLWVLLNNLQNPRKHNRISLMEESGFIYNFMCSSHFYIALLTMSAD